MRQEALKTGGGLPTPEKFEDFDNLVLATMDPLTVEGHSNRFDCDDDNLEMLESAADVVFETSFLDSEKENWTIQPSPANQNEINLNDTQIEPEETVEMEKQTWKSYKVDDLKIPINPILVRPTEEDTVGATKQGIFEIQEPGTSAVNTPVRRTQQARKQVRRGTDRRRPTSTIIKTLTSSSLAEKYEILVDQKIIIAKQTLQKLEREALNGQEEHELRKKVLQLEIEIKKKQLEKLSR